MARLIMQREGRSKEYELAEEVVLGRKSTCNIRVPSPKCSREHSRIIKGSGGFFVEDMGSSNGTVVNGKKIGRQLLKSGDVITIGGIDYTFQDKVDDPLVGKRLGKYQILDKVGVGGMGVVYRASQVTLGREVALKVMSPRLATKASFIQSFEREAKIAARLQHPNIIGIHDFGHEDEWYFFSMEFVEGENLLDMALRQGGLSIDECLEFGRQLADALDHAHNQGILHKDIKPQNVMINNDNRVKLADMGLASIADEENHESSPESGAFMATPQYVAPEIIRRQEPDPRSDIYSLAATLFHMLTSKPPYTGTDVKDLLKKHLNAPVPDPRSLRPDIPEDLALFVMKGLAKDPVERQQSAREFAEGLALLQQRALHPAAEKKLPKPAVSALLKAASTRSAAIAAERSLPPRKADPKKKLYFGVGGGVSLLLALVVVIVLVRGNPDEEAEKLFQQVQSCYIDGDDAAARERLDQLLQNYPHATVAAEARRMQQMYQGTPAQRELYRVKSELAAGKTDSKRVVRQLKLFLQQQGSLPPEDLRAIQDFITIQGEDPDIRSEWERQVDELATAGKMLDALELARRIGTISPKDEERKRAAVVLQNLQSSLESKAKALQEKALGLCDRKDFAGAAALLSDIILNYPGTSSHPQAAMELATLNDDAIRAFGAAWGRIREKAAANDLAGVRAVAAQGSKPLSEMALAAKGRELELYAEGLEAFYSGLLGAAKDGTRDTAGQVRVMVDGKERTVSLDVEGGKLFAVGQKNRKEIELSDVAANDVSRLMPGNKIEPLQALGGAVYFASHRAPDLAQEYARVVALAEGELAAAGADLGMLLKGQAPLADFAAILAAPAALRNCRVINKSTITFYGEGSYVNPRLAVRPTDLRMRLQVSDRIVIEALGHGGAVFTLTRKGATLEARAGSAKKEIRYPQGGLNLRVQQDALQFFDGERKLGELAVADVTSGAVLLKLRATGSAEVQTMELGVDLPALKAEPAASEERKPAAPTEQTKPEEDAKG